MEQYHSNHQNNLNESHNYTQNANYTQNNHDNLYQVPVYDTNPTPPPQKPTGIVFNIIICFLLVINLIFTAFVYINMPPKKPSARDLIDENKAVIKYSKQVANDNLKLDDLEYIEDDEGGSSYIEANLENNSDEKLVDITVTFECFDKNDNYICEERVFIDCINGNEDYEISQTVYDSEVFEVKLKHITAYYESDFE